MHQRHNGHKNSLNNKDHKQHPQLSSRHLHQQNAFKPQWPWTLLKVTSIKNALNILLCHRTKDTLKPQWPQISSEQQWSRMKLKSQWPWPLFTITGIKNCPQQSAMHLPQKHLQITLIQTQTSLNLIKNKTLYPVILLHQKYLMITLTHKLTKVYPELTNSKWHDSQQTRMGGLKAETQK